jgi:hypothetical protein
MRFLFGYFFFSKLTAIINLISVSPKHYTELHYAQAIEITHMVATGGRETGRGANKIGNLHQSRTISETLILILFVT